MYRGLFYKWLALRPQITVDISDAADRKMVEVARVHSDQTIANLPQYFREHADLPYMLALFDFRLPQVDASIVTRQSYLPASQTYPIFRTKQKRQEKGVGSLCCEPFRGAWRAELIYASLPSD